MTPTRSAWTFRLSLRLEYQPMLKRWPRVRVEVKPSLWREGSSS